MSAVKTWQERATAKRRKAAVERALRYLNEGLAGLPSARKGTAEKRVRASAQPMRTARALVKDWRSRARATEPTVGDRPDLSTATEARAALLRRQPLALRRSAAYEDELAELERKLVKITGEAFSKLEPVRISAGQGKCTVAVNRRNNLEPDVPELRKNNALKGPFDHSVPVLAVHSGDGTLGS